VADEEDFDVAPVKAELLDAVADLWWRGLEVGVDEDVALRRGDEVGREVAAADVVKVVGDAEGREGRGPVGVLVGAGGEREKGEGEEDECEAAHEIGVADFAVQGAVRNLKRQQLLQCGVDVADEVADVAAAVEEGNH